MIMTVARWTGGFLRRNPSRSPRPVWLRLLRHTVRIDSSCAHVSPRGPHSELCATIRGPPCKQGATFTTLHVYSFDLHTYCVKAVRHQAGKHWLEGIFFRSAHVLARREPQCPTRASVPDEGLSARREQVRASPTRSPHGPPHGPPHDSPHTEADLRRIDGLQFPIQWKTSIWYAFAAYAEPTPDN